MPITSTRVDTERDGARTSAQGMDGLRDEITVHAEQMGALCSAVSPDAWCGACADAFRGHVAELAHNASSLAMGYDDVAVAQALDALYEDVEDVEDAKMEHRRRLPNVTAWRSGKPSAAGTREEDPGDPDRR